MIHIATDFPLAGRLCKIVYDDLIAYHDFRTPGKLLWEVSAGEPPAGTADMSATRVRDDLWVVTFDDPPAFGVIVQDLSTETVHTHVKLPDLPVMYMVGRLEIVR
jgi:hypothetical protein